MDTALIKLIEKKGLRLELVGESSFKVIGDDSLIDSDLVEKLRTEKKNVLRWLKKIYTANDLEIQPVSRSSESFPVSFAQKRMWFLEKMSSGGGQYNMPTTLYVSGNFDLSVAEGALSDIISRHEILRTTYKQYDTEVRQAITDCFKFQLKIHDLRDRSSDDGRREAKSIVHQEITKGFDLGADLMLRSAFIKLKSDGQEETGVFLIVVHHIAADGWSKALLIKEFSDLYTKKVKQENGHPPPLKIQYVDYSVWQNRRITESILDSQQIYWQRKLADLPSVHSLPLRRIRPPVKSEEGKELTFDLPINVSMRLASAAGEHGMSMFALLCAALALVISRYSGSNEVVIGTPIANRDNPDLRDLIGLFVNTLVLRIHVNHALLFQDYLRHVGQTVLEAQSNGDVPFERVVELTNAVRTTAWNPLFQIMFTMDTGFEKVAGLPGTRMEYVSVDKTGSKFDLDFRAKIISERVCFSCTFDTELFAEAQIAQMMTHLKQLLTNISTDPRRSVSEIEMMSPVELKSLLEASDPEGISSDTRPFHEEFQANALATPEAPAVKFHDESLSYGELNNLSKELAGYLRNLGVDTDTMVGLCIERSPEALVAILGIAMAGGVFVPIDPASPPAKVRQLVQNLGLRHMVVRSDIRSLLGFAAIEHVIEFDRRRYRSELRKLYSGKLEKVASNLNGLAYVMHTSGSTGIPKPIGISHSSLLNYLLFARDAYFADSRCGVVSTSLCFDATITTLLTPLLSGGCVEILNDGLDVTKQLADHLAASTENCVYKITPSHLETLVHRYGHSVFTDVRHVIVVGGEKLMVKPVAAFKEKVSPYSMVINEYGPTETVVGSATYIVPHDMDSLKERSTVPIGNPISNTKLYVLDGDRRLVPKHAVGELYIGGAGVARGYLNSAHLTCQRFISNPYGKNRGDCLYRTGDFVRRLDDGTLDFIGRVDSQIKINGIRLELGDVEAAIDKLDAVSRCAVLLNKNRYGKPILIAYVVLERPEEVLATPNEMPGILYAELSRELPRHAIPARFVFLDEMPMTQNGKVDVRSLERCEIEQCSPVKEKRDLTTHESLVVEIVQEILGVDGIDADDNVFELGGNSLDLMAIQTKLANSGYKLPLQELYSHQSVSSLSACLDSYQGDTRESLPRNVNILAGDGARSEKVFLIHPLSGVTACYDELCEPIGNSATCYGVQLPHLFEERSLTSFIALCEEYTGSIMAIQPRGPYALIGWSLGGRLAYEIGRQIRAKGEKVSFVGLIDSAPVSRMMNESSQGRDRYASIKSYCFENNLHIPWASISEMPDREAIETITDVLMENDESISSGSKEIIHRFIGYQLELNDALEKYVSPNSDLDLSLFKCGNSVMERMAPQFSCEDYGWGALTTGKVDVVNLNCTHEDVLKKPVVDQLKKEIMDRLRV